jgi:hypothetical protein
MQGAADEPHVGQRVGAQLEDRGANLGPAPRVSSPDAIERLPHTPGAVHALPLQRALGRPQI